MNSDVTDDDVRQLAAKAKPYSLVVLRWANRDHSEEVKLGAAHQRRMVELRRDGIIAILCPVVSDTICGVAVLTVPIDEAARIMNDDPCVQSGIMSCPVVLCHSFAGDALP